MSKETTNYIIIGAAATAVLYYLYTRSATPKVPTINPPPVITGLDAFQQTTNDAGLFGTTDILASNWWNLYGFGSYSGSYGGSGAGGAW